jgi:predicted dehydrogenase
VIRTAVIGLGKMGISHLAIANAHPSIDVVACCDASDYVLGTVGRYTGLRTYSDFGRLLEAEPLDAVIIATPSRLHVPMVEASIAHGLHVFVEKPFTLDPAASAELVAAAQSRSIVTQVGYHYRFVATFREARRLIAAGALGDVHHYRVEAYGPVVTRGAVSTWRGRRSEGGGCLYDYASHALDLGSFLFGRMDAVRGAVLSRIYSTEVDDEVYATLEHDGGPTGQLAANWSDESERKMSMQLTVWGRNGRLTADRQEVTVYLRESSPAAGYAEGWTTRSTTELTEPVWFYLRGEEYSSQIDHFARCIEHGDEPEASFAAALVTDQAVAMTLASAASAAPPEPSAIVGLRARPAQ